MDIDIFRAAARELIREVGAAYHAKRVEYRQSIDGEPSKGIGSANINLDLLFALRRHKRQCNGEKVLTVYVTSDFATASELCKRLMSSIEVKKADPPDVAVHVRDFAPEGKNFATLSVMVLTTSPEKSEKIDGIVCGVLGHTPCMRGKINIKTADHK